MYKALLEVLGRLPPDTVGGASLSLRPHMLRRQICCRPRNLSLLSQLVCMWQIPLLASPLSRGEKRAKPSPKQFSLVLNLCVALQYL